MEYFPLQVLVYVTLCSRSHPMASPISPYPINLASAKNLLASVICQPWAKLDFLFQTLLAVPMV